MKQKKIKLGQLQLELMELLWEKGSATAKELTDEMSKKAPTAHSTVQTLLRRLEAKGAVKHESNARTFLYSPAVERTEIQQAAIQDVFRGVFRGSASLLLANLIESEEISQDELRELRTLIDSKTKEKGK